MSHLTAPILLSLMAVSTAGTPGADCKNFLTGDWAGKGEVKGFGAPVAVDNSASYKADRTFVTHNRYLGTDKSWKEQRVSGRWSAKAGRARGTCVLTMTTTGQGFSSSSTSDFQIVNKDIFRSMGFDMKRVRK